MRVVCTPNAATRSAVKLGPNSLTKSPGGCERHAGRLVSSAQGCSQARGSGNAQSAAVKQQVASRNSCQLRRSSHDARRQVSIFRPTAQPSDAQAGEGRAQVRVPAGPEGARALTSELWPQAPHNLLDSVWAKVLEKAWSGV
jgi:hypothetical protein